MKNVIKLNLGDNYSIRPYVVCDTTAKTRAKSISYNGFNIVDGATIAIKFINGNTYAGDDNIQLSINNVVKYTNCNKSLNGNEILEFIYDEDEAIWRVIDGGAFASDEDIKGLFGTK